MDESRNYKKLAVRQYPTKSIRETAEGRFWRKFKSSKTVQQPGAVTSIDFCESAPHDLAITASTRVVLYDGKTHSQKRLFSRFQDVAYSGSLRPDGKVIVAGGETGIVQVFDAGSRLVLRQMKGHTRAVHFCRYAKDKLHVISAGDDNTVRWWDAASEAPIWKFDGHTDYVRCGAPSEVSADVWATGSYDHSVRLWDIRSGKCVMELQHGRPVEDVAFFPSGGLLVSAGANYLNIWDIMGGGRMLQRLCNHQKTITAVQISSPVGIATNSSVIGGGGPRLLSASLDGHVKIYELDSFKVTHVVRYPDAILSMGLSPNMQTLVVGMSTGLLSIRKLKGASTKAQTTEAMAKKEQGRQKAELEMGSGDYLVADVKRKALKEFDKLLQKFQHREALTVALKTWHPDVVVSVMEELIARRNLTSALSGRDAESLSPLLSFLSKFIMIPRHSKLFVQVAHRVLDLYAGMLGLSPEIDDQMTQLRLHVLEEVRLQQALQSLQGMLEPLILQSAMSRIEAAS